MEEIREGGVYLPDEWLFSTVLLCALNSPLSSRLEGGVGKNLNLEKPGEDIWWKRAFVSLERFQIGCTNSSQVAKSSHISRWKTRKTDKELWPSFWQNIPLFNNTTISNLRILKMYRVSFLKHIVVINIARIANLPYYSKSEL